MASAEGQEDVLGALREGGAAEGAARVWWFACERVLRSAETLGWLSVDERLRARGFARAVDRARFEARRVARRAVLGAVLGVRPENVEFEVGLLGRERVVGGVVFSSSHSAGVGVIAVGVERAGRLGVDVEVVSAELGTRAVWSAFVAGAEAAELEAAWAAGRDLAGLAARAWVRKEAVLKALGLGLTIDPRRVDVRGEGARVGDALVRVGDLEVPAGVMGDVVGGGAVGCRAAIAWDWA